MTVIVKELISVSFRNSWFHINSTRYTELLNMVMSLQGVQFVLMTTASPIEICNEKVGKFKSLMPTTSLYVHSRSVHIRLSSRLSNPSLVTRWKATSYVTDFIPGSHLVNFH